MPENENQLKENSLGLAESIIMGVAGTAPAFSIAATTSLLMGTTGKLSMATLLYFGIIMMGITLAFHYLNRTHPHAGASYAWVGRVFHPILGFLAGWSLLMAAAVFMVSGTVPVATATLSLLSPENIENTALVTLVAAGWLILVGFIVLKGIKLSSYFQVLTTLVEVGILIFITFYVIYSFSGAPILPLSWNQFSPMEFTLDTFATGAITSLFFFWGWDVTINLSEETKDAQHTSGLGAVIAMVIVIALFSTFLMAVQFSATPQEVEKAGTNLVYVLASKVLSSPFAYLAIVAVILSTLGTLETTILQFTRTLFATGRDGVLHPRYGKLHKEWKTPSHATFLVLSLGLGLLFLSSFIPTVEQIISISIKVVGLQVAFYYGLTAFACAWNFRKEALESISNFLLLFLWPLTSAFFMVFIFYFSTLNFDWPTNLIGIGGIFIGIVPYLWNKKKNHPKSS